MTKRPGQKPNESAIEYLRRAISGCGYESENLLEQLPSVESVCDFFDLWHAYDTDFWAGILECIADGDDPAKARAFVRKWKLGQAWRDDINDAIKAREPVNA